MVQTKNILHATDLPTYIPIISTNASTHIMQCNKLHLLHKSQLLRQVFWKLVCQLLRKSMHRVYAIQLSALRAK